MFGKTRLGKSNVVKLLAQAIIDATESDKTVGQLIFDINGEYANDNPQDGSRSIRSANANVCDVYALTKRPDTPSKPLRYQFLRESLCRHCRSLDLCWGRTIEALTISRDCVASDCLPSRK